MHVGSALLSADTRSHWQLIQKTDGGTATLLKHFEEYTNTLAQNMRKTYLNPFTIITPNIGENTHTQHNTNNTHSRTCVC